MTLRLDEPDEQALQELADELGLSKHAAVLRAIHEAADRHRRRTAVEEILDEEVPRWRGVLDRLAQ